MRNRQQGAALMLLAAILVLGIGWYTVRAMGTVAPAVAEREIKTGLALQAGKQALLAYAAQYAARSSTASPGQMPCPEAVTLSNPGETYGSCSGTAILVGRLPWKSLGVDPIFDGYGEPLWYILRGFRDAPINFGTPGQLTYNGSPVVAMVIAPGRPLNTSAVAGLPPAGCIQQNQMVATRGAASLNPAHYLECGVTTGSITAPGDSAWTNDRVIAITAEEWIAAIAGPVGDRLQREVAPALAEWRSTESDSNWGERFLPGASTFSNPASNGLCGTYGTREGLMPVARSAASTCATWTGGNVTQLLGLVGAETCAQVGTSYQCQFTGLSLLGLLSARVRARAPNAGQSFRDRISATDIGVSHGGNVSNFSLTLDPADGDVNIDFRVTLPVILSIETITVTIPNLPDAAILSDSRMAWFVNNDWARHTYYSIAPGSQLNAGSGCSFAGDTDCVTLNGLPAANGDANDKRFVLALMGPALTTQSRSCATDADSDTIVDCDERVQYVESRTNSTTYHQDRIDAVFNDRLATCPFQQLPANGTPLSICN
jgi:hypothetical protein